MSKTKINPVPGDPAPAPDGKGAALLGGGEPNLAPLLAELNRQQDRADAELRLRLRYRLLQVTLDMLNSYDPVPTDAMGEARELGEPEEPGTESP